MNWNEKRPLRTHFNVNHRIAHVFPCGPFIFIGENLYIGKRRVCKVDEVSSRLGRDNSNLQPQTLWYDENNKITIRSTNAYLCKLCQLSHKHCRFDGRN